MLTDNHKKSLKIIIAYYGLTEHEGSLLSRWEIEFLYRRIQSHTMKHAEVENEQSAGAASEEFKKYHPWLGKNVFEETVKHVFPKEGEIIEEWGGTLRCNTSDGRNVNIADELNK